VARPRSLRRRRDETERIYFRFRTEMRRTRRFDIEARAYFNKLEDGDPAARALWRPIPRDLQQSSTRPLQARRLVRSARVLRELSMRTRNCAGARVTLHGQGILDDFGRARAGRPRRPQAAAVPSEEVRSGAPALKKSTRRATWSPRRSHRRSRSSHFDQRRYVRDKAKHTTFRHGVAGAGEIRACYPFSGCRARARSSFGRCAFGGKKTSTRG